MRRWLPTHYSPAGVKFPLSSIVFMQVLKIIWQHSLSCERVLGSPRAKTRPQPKIPIYHSKGRATQVTCITNQSLGRTAKTPAGHRGSGKLKALGQHADEINCTAHHCRDKDWVPNVADSWDLEDHHRFHKNRRGSCDIISKSTSLAIMGRACSARTTRSTVATQRERT